MTKKTPIKKIIQRKLLFRLGLMILGVTFFFAGFSYYHSRNMITNAVIQASSARIDVVQGRFKELMQDAVNYPPGTKNHIDESVDLIGFSFEIEVYEKVGRKDSKSTSSLVAGPTNKL